MSLFDDPTPPTPPVAPTVVPTIESPTVEIQQESPRPKPENPFFLLLLVIWFWTIQVPMYLVLDIWDEIRGRQSETERFPYHGSNHRGSPW